MELHTQTAGRFTNVGGFYERKNILKIMNEK